MRILSHAEGMAKSRLRGNVDSLTLINADMLLFVVCGGLIFELIRVIFTGASNFF